MVRRTSDGKVKEKEVAEASGKTMRLDTGGITGTNQASENNEQVEISQGVSQPVDNLQKSQEPIVQPTPHPSNTSQLQGGVFNRPFRRPGMANQNSNSLNPEPRYFLHRGQKVTIRKEFESVKSLKVTQKNKNI